MDEFNSLFEIFENIDNDYFNDQHFDKTPFYYSIEEEKSQTSKCELERAFSIACSLRTFMARPKSFAIISVYGEARYTAGSMLIWLLWSRKEVIKFRCCVRGLYSKTFSLHYLKQASFNQKSLIYSERRILTPHHKIFESFSKSVRRFDCFPFIVREIIRRMLSGLLELVRLSSCWRFRLLGLSYLWVYSTAHTTRWAKLPKKSGVLLENRDGVFVPASPESKVELHTTSCAEPSKMNNIVKFQNLSYQEEVDTSFKAKVISAVHIQFSTTIEIYLEHRL